MAKQEVGYSYQLVDLQTGESTLTEHIVKNIRGKSYNGTLPIYYSPTTSQYYYYIDGGFQERVVKRYFTDLTPAGGQYYDLGDGFALSGDFEIEGKFSTKNNTEQWIYSSWEDLTDNRSVAIRLKQGALQTYISSDGVDTIAGPVGQNIPLNTLIKFALKFETTGDLTLFVNDQVAGVVNTGIPSINSSYSAVKVGRKTTGFSYFDGIISDLKIWTGGDRNTGTLIADYPLDEDWVSDNIAHNKADPLNNATAINITSTDSTSYDYVPQRDWLGEDFLTNGSFDTDTDWTKGAGWSISGGQAVKVNTSENSLLYQSVVRPSNYRVTVDLENVTGRGVIFYNGPSYSTEISASGVSTFDVENFNISYAFFTINTDNIDTAAVINSVSAKRLLKTA